MASVSLKELIKNAWGNVMNWSNAREDAYYAKRYSQNKLDCLSGHEARIISDVAYDRFDYMQRADLEAAGGIGSPRAGGPCILTEAYRTALIADRMEYQEQRDSASSSNRPPQAGPKHTAYTAG